MAVCDEEIFFLQSLWLFFISLPVLWSSVTLTFNLKIQCELHSNFYVLPFFSYSRDGTNRAYIIHCRSTTNVVSPVVLTAGALNLLTNVETIDWTALYSGEICIDEVHRVRRVARRDIISLPTFLADVDKYRKQLREIAVINGLDPNRTSSPAKSSVQTPPQNRQRITAKLTVTPATRRFTKRVNRVIPTAMPAVAEEADTNKVENISRSKDTLRLTGCASHVDSFRLMSTTAKRLARMQCERPNYADGFSLSFKRFNFLTPQQWQRSVWKSGSVPSFIPPLLSFPLQGPTPKSS